MLEQTTDKDVYDQYEKLYRALLVTEDVESLYKDRKGNVHDTFVDLLKNINRRIFFQLPARVGLLCHLYYF